MFFYKYKLVIQPIKQVTYSCVTIFVASTCTSSIPIAEVPNSYLSGMNAPIHNYSFFTTKIKSICFTIN